jgi:Rrf2 family transcriptional regulator, cysteine metabolism repressor
MKLTTKSEYALLALIYIARQDQDSYYSSESTSLAQQIPHKYLEQILLTLKRARIVISYKGQNGGYKLAKSPNKVHLAEVVRLFDGALAPIESVSKYFYEPSPIEKEEKLLAIFKDIRDYIAEKLEKTTLADLI